MKMDFLSKLKIEPQYNKGIQLKYNVIGFRGVREGLGTTTLLNHIAVAIAAKNVSVCVLDLDFACPDQVFSNAKTFSISAKLNRQSESIMNIINSTDYSSVSYVGPNINETILDYLPMLIDEAYLNGRGQVLATLIGELTKKFDAVLVDIPSDIRVPEGTLAMEYCDIVYTLCKVNQTYVGKLQRDAAILSSMLGDKAALNIINVYEDIEGAEVYKSVSKDTRLVTDMAFSMSIATASLNSKINHVKKSESCDSLEEIMYYTAIRDIINDLRSEEE